MKPQTIELIHPTAEMAVLAGLCGRDIDLAIELSKQIDPLDFSNATGQVIAEAAMRVLRGYEPLDAMNLWAAARDVATERKLTGTNIPQSMIEALIVGDTSRSLAYAATVKRYAWLRRAQEFAEWFGSEVADIADPDELFTAAQERIQHLAPAQRAANFVYGWDTVKEHDSILRERMRQFQKGEALVFDWPWASWNEKVRPLRSGMLGVVAAPDGIGKSTVLEMVAEHWARKAAHVVFVHLENDFDYTMNRRLCRWSKVPIAAIEDGNLTDAQLTQIRNSYDDLGDLLTLHYLDAAGWTMAELVAELSIRHSEGVCDAVVVDYLNKVRPSRDQARLFSGRPFERQADDAELLKSWAVKHKVPAFTAVQMNKDAQGSGRQTRQNIRGSGEISEKSQLVVVLTREICENDEIGPNGMLTARKGEYSPLMTVRVDKQNRGRTAEWQMFYNGRHFEVRDVLA
jgi:replicative DNA helicase